MALFRRHLVLAVPLFAALSAAPALAQCVMCGLAAEQAADPASVSRTFSAAVVILLGPVQVVIGAIALLAWKARRWDGARFRDELPDGDRSSLSGAVQRR